jgi:hypothetical protein
MTEPQWTYVHTKAEIRAWIHATPEQREDAFLDLLAAVCAVAEHRQNEMAINTLREIGAKRDGVKP